MPLSLYGYFKQTRFLSENYCYAQTARHKIDQDYSIELRIHNDSFLLVILDIFHRSLPQATVLHHPSGFLSLR